MKTEEEAKTLMCIDGSRYLCIASNCMAWRWDDDSKALQRDNPARRGYCGLAGKP